MASTAKISTKTVVYESSEKHSGPPDLRLLHFNDVYHVEAGSAEPVGGIARFQSLVNYYRGDAAFSGLPELLTFFSGDVFNPSLESSVTKGRHMVPVLNNIGTTIACIGNHDLDFGVPQFTYLAEQCHFPWLIANVLDPALGDNVALGGCAKTTMILSSNGIKVGVIGLAEKEWLDTINSLPSDLIYKSATATAKELIPGLKEQGAEIIVALTHMREPNDMKLAENLSSSLIDIILGGHDHFYNHVIVNGVHVLRSGTDFRQLSYIEAWKKDNGKGWDFDITRRDITREIAEDPSTMELVNRLTVGLKAKLEKPIGYTAAPLDGRFTTVRTKESNLGNFVCDLMRYYYNTDCAIMAAGTIRGDQVYPPGTLLLGDIMNCFPFEDPVVVIKVRGKAILEALENGVGSVPALEGRFPQVSNIHFEFDPQARPLHRVKWVRIAGVDLDRDKLYTLSTRGYMARGKDGYDSLLIKDEGGDAEVLVSEENGVLISMILRQFFMSLKVLGRWRRWGGSLRSQWSGVNDRLFKHHGVKEPGPHKTLQKVQRLRKHPGNRNAHIETPIQSPGRLKNPLLRRVQRSLVGDGIVDSENEDESDAVTPEPSSAEDHEKDQRIARQVLRKWFRLAGIQREHVGLVSENEEEFLPHWTRGIAPKIEGRILITQHL